MRTKLQNTIATATATATQQSGCRDHHEVAGDSVVQAAIAHMAGESLASERNTTESRY